MNKHLAIAASIMAFAVAVPANAAYVLNTNGGTGSVVVNPNGFTLTGSNGGTNTFVSTTYTDTATSAQTITFNFDFNYTTSDRDGSSFDPAGYLINGSLFQLSQDGLPQGSGNSGTTSFSVNAGDVYGFYVNSVDDSFGPAQLSISFGAVPEPATWAMMIAGFGFVGAASRRRIDQRKAAVHA